MSDAASLLGLLADPDRLKVVAALVLGAETADDVTQATGLDRRTVGRALARLQSAALVEIEDRRYQLVLERLSDAARSARGAPPAPDDAVAPPLRPFLRDGRLLAIPVARTKRLVVLEWLAQRFEPGLVYPERDVNDQLRTAHPDVAALRRYLVDEGFLDRRDGKYWRSGGAFEVDPEVDP